MENSPFPATSGNDSSNSVKTRSGSAGEMLQNGVNKATDPAHGAVDRLSTVAHDTVDKVASTASQAAGKLSQQTQRLSEGSAKAYEMTQDWVKEKPMGAVGAALAIGFILGRLTGR